ncbi:hypothetical protein AN958_01767 [Leucoagaricus sp. SymC.cos]|nr:hypothetical protein AN958_01767 [Leucoagaricus sp. SymC.cos]
MLLLKKSSLRWGASRSSDFPLPTSLGKRALTLEGYLHRVENIAKLEIVITPDFDDWEDPFMRE